MKYGSMPNSWVYQSVAASRSAAQKLTVASPRRLVVSFVVLLLWLFKFGFVIATLEGVVERLIPKRRPD